MHLPLLHHGCHAEEPYNPTTKHPCNLVLVFTDGDKLLHAVRFSMNATSAGEVVAVYHYQEGEVEKAPAIVGETALLAGSEGQYSVRPCGYRWVYVLCQ